jgi:transcriptional regulator with XRE-family HTH domain
MTIAENLRRLRQEARLSQTALAKKAGVTQQLISQLEGGENDTTRALPNLAEALGVTVDKIDPNYVPGAPSRNAALAEIHAIYAALEGFPDLQEQYLEQARLLEARARKLRERQAPAPADGRK